MFEIVDLSDNESEDKPSPQNSTNLPTTFIFLNLSVIVNTTSVAVTPSFKFPSNITPTTSGIFIEIG